MHLERLIKLLETIAAAGRALSVNELHGLTGYPKPTCYRLVQDLASHGLIEAEGKGVYGLGQRVLRLALVGRSDADIRLAAASILKEGADAHGAAFFLSRLRGEGVEIIHVETPADARVSFVHPGLGFRPMHACSCAKAIAAFSGEALQKRASDGDLRAYTAKTAIDGAVVRAEFDAIRARGFAECVEEIEIGVASVAAPVHLSGAGAPVSIGATGTIRMFGPARRRALGEALIDLAGRLSAVLEAGYLSEVAAE
ncbi:MAG: IclR family transcriptional regulator [Pseudomonadota bacterium]